MYDKAKIKTCATSLVGFRQDDNAIYATLSAALKTSNSGLNVNDLPGANFEIIAAALSSDAADANTYLTNVYESELYALVNKFVSRSKDNYNSKELLSNHSITSGVASFKNKVTQNARFVGYLITPVKSNNLNIEIKQMGLQVTETQATPLKIFLYVTSRYEPLQTFDFPVTAENSLRWEAITDFILRYESESEGTGQQYLLGYYENDPDNAQTWQLQSQALYMQFDCGCGYTPAKVHGKYAAISPIEINNDLLNWDAANGTYNIPEVDNYSDFITNQTYGLTAKVNVTCDITTVICANIGLFAPALQHAIATRILWDAYGSIRINSITDSKRTQALQFAKKYEGILDGYTDANSNKHKGLIDTLGVDFSGLDRICLKCKQGIRIGGLVR